jgi:hypothetical protein
VLTDLLKEVKPGVVHITNESGQPLCGCLSRWRVVTSSWVADNSETTCQECRRLLGLPPTIAFPTSDGALAYLVVTGDEATGTIWVPVWLVWDRPDALWWINEDPDIHPQGVPLGDVRNIFRVPRSKWRERMAA